MVRNISVIQSLSVSWCSESYAWRWSFKFISISDKKIGKNIFEIRKKYFRISKSVDRSTPHSDFLEEVPKSGENLVVLWWKIFVLRIV